MSIVDSHKEVISSLVEKDNELYMEDEKDLIDLSKRVRKELVENMVKGGVPEKSGDIRVLNEVLSAMDSQVNQLAVNRLRVKDSENNTDTAAMVKELIEAVQLKKLNMNVEVNRERSLNSNYKLTDVVPGELDINPEPLALDDFID